MKNDTLGRPRGGMDADLALVLLLLVLLMQNGAPTELIAALVYIVLPR